MNILGSTLHGFNFAFSELVFVQVDREKILPCCVGEADHAFFGFVFTIIGVILKNDFKGMAS